MLRSICMIAGLVLLLILFPLIFGGTAASLILFILMAVVLFLGIRLVSGNFKAITEKTVFKYEKKTAVEKQAENPISEEDGEYSRVYAGKAPVPADARSRSDYIRWLMEKGHYEEANRVQSL